MNIDKIIKKSKKGNANKQNKSKRFKENLDQEKGKKSEFGDSIICNVNG